MAPSSLLTESEASTPLQCSIFLTLSLPLVSSPPLSLPLYLALLGLSCGMQDLQSLLRHRRSFIAADGIFSCGMWDPVS